MKRILAIFFGVLSYSLTYGQVTFTAIPMDSELVARDIKTNLGKITVKGTVNSANTPYDSIELIIYRGGVLKDSIYQALSYAGNCAPFNFAYQIPAELKEYAVRIYGIKKAAKSPDTTINAIVAGDVYVIEGQSNAFAMGRDGETADSNKSEFIRVFANSDSSTAGMMNNLSWFQGEGDGGFKENGHAGQWGLKLGRLLVDSMHMPVAIFNGACGGTPITYYMRPANYKTNINSNYGRLYYRLAYTGLQNNVRAIIWSQGETDGYIGTSTSTYVNEFNTLQKSWKQDFPGMQKTYIFQTKTEDIYPEYNIMAIEEAQREIAAENDSDIEIIPTAALKPDKGGLHFDFTGGYEVFGDRIYNLIKRDIYEVPNSNEIDAPMITNAYLKDSTTLVIVEKTDSLEQYNPTSPLQSYEVENGNGASINNIYYTKNTITLKLSKYPGSDVTVSYLAPLQDTGTNWLTNTLGLDLVCFYEYPVVDSMQGIATTMEESVVSTMKAYPNPFHDYINITLNANGIYLLELDDLSGRKLEEIVFTGNQYKLSAENLSKGMYFLRVFDSERNLVGVLKTMIQ